LGGLKWDAGPEKGSENVSGIGEKRDFPEKTKGGVWATLFRRREHPGVGGPGARLYRWKRKFRVT